MVWSTKPNIKTTTCNLSQTLMTTWSMCMIKSLTRRHSRSSRIISEILSWSTFFSNLLASSYSIIDDSLIELNGIIIDYLNDGFSFVRVFIAALLLEHFLISSREKDLEIFFRWMAIAPKFNVNLAYDVIFFKLELEYDWTQRDS